MQEFYLKKNPRLCVISCSDETYSVIQHVAVNTTTTHAENEQAGAPLLKQRR
jgi:hypothetical protein